MTAQPAIVPAEQPLRFGLVGTGYWARAAHARALASTPGVEFAAVWGRNPAAAAELAASHGATAHEGFGSFLADVDCVAFSVPPDVQSHLAVRAAGAGKHLLLEKPIATSAATARALAQAVREAGVASVVFFVARYQPAIRAWLAEVAAGHWAGGSAVWLGSSLAADSPFNTPWRREKGGLWDLGPHALSVLAAALGPVTSVTADAGAGDLSYLVLHHDTGATSTVTLTLNAPPTLDSFDVYVWGQRGKSAMPALAGDPVAALRVALTELADGARAGDRGHPCDVHFGSEVTRVLAEAERQLAARGQTG
ncbi:MAG TPA: Gfo/Idh/MocA family oxidoreductase [Streptosporangiaceae bacterium]|nr:Gfo/Idh/MocA family oxidoreductase [Streptosporangiaceae bacterium]